MDGLDQFSLVSVTPVCLCSGCFGAAEAHVLSPGPLQKVCPPLYGGLWPVRLNHRAQAGGRPWCMRGLHQAFEHLPCAWSTQ